MEKKNQNIHARVVHYNAVKLLNALSQIVGKNGGHIVSSYKTELTFSDVHCRKDTLRIANPDDVMKDCPVITTPFWGCFTCFAHFHINGFVYYIEFPSNIFDNITIGKVSVDDTLTSYKKYYCVQLQYSSQLIDTLYNLDPRQDSNDTIVEEAQKLFNTISEMPVSETYETRAVEVPNLYDGGHHTEMKRIPYKCKYNKFDANTGLLIE